MKTRSTLIHSLRVVTGFGLLGAVTAGTLFGGAPVLGALGVHEVGAILGAALGVAASAKQVI